MRINWTTIDPLGAYDKLIKTDALVVDTSNILGKRQRNWIARLPLNLNSFYFRLNALEEAKNVARFIYKVYSENSLNFKEYSFVGETFLPTEYGDFMFFGFENRINGKRILGVRTLDMSYTPTVRMHSMCYTGDIFHSLKCDCREEFANALKMIQSNTGILIYPEEEGRGIGVLNKISVYQHQFQGLDTVEAQYADHFPNDLRTYDYLKDIFRHYDVSTVKLISNNPDKSDACFEAGVYVEENIFLPSTVTPHNEQYLKTKNEKSRHTIRLNYVEKTTS